MKAAVRYHSRTGNTKKLAEAIAEAVGTSAETLDKPLEEAVDVLFLGSAVYAAGVDDEVKRFIAALGKGKVGCVVCFSTAALLPSTYKQVKGLCEAAGLRVEEREFHCRGKFAVMHRNSPNAADCEAAAAFAKRFV